jgi:hypothetical protein
VQRFPGAQSAPLAQDVAQSPRAQTYGAHDVVLVSDVRLAVRSSVQPRHWCSAVQNAPIAQSISVLHAIGHSPFAQRYSSHEMAGAPTTATPLPSDVHAWHACAPVHDSPDAQSPSPWQTVKQAPS